MGIMRVSNSDVALNFAIRAYEIKSSENLEIFNAIIIGDILKKHRFSEEVVAAGYLSTVTKTTDYTNKDIARLFGGEIASLLLTTIEINEKDLSQLKLIKDLPLKNRVIIAASAITKLEAQRIKLQTVENLDLALIDFETQKTYYKQLLDILEEDAEHQIFDELYNCIYKMYYNPHAGYEVSQEDLEATPQEKLTALKDLLESKKPYIVEFTHDKQSKSSLITVVNDFLENDSITLKVIENSNQECPDKNGINRTEANFLIACEIEKGLLLEVVNDNNLLLVNQGLFNRLIWFKKLINRGGIYQEKVEEYKEYYLPELSKTINHVRLNYTKRFKNPNNYESTLDNLVKLFDGEPILSDVPENEQRIAACQAVGHLIPFMPKQKILELKEHIQKKAS